MFFLGPSKRQIREANEEALRSHSHWVNEDVVLRTSGEFTVVSHDPPEKKYVKNPKYKPEFKLMGPNELPTEPDEPMFIAKWERPEVRTVVKWESVDYYCRNTGKYKYSDVTYYNPKSPYPPLPIMKKWPDYEDLTPEQLVRHRRV